jgi:hypothetical protein
LRYVLKNGNQQAALECFCEFIHWKGGGDRLFGLVQHLHRDYQDGTRVSITLTSLRRSEVKITWEGQRFLFLVGDVAGIVLRDSEAWNVLPNSLPMPGRRFVVGVALYS